MLRKISLILFLWYSAAVLFREVFASNATTVGPAGHAVANGSAGRLVSPSTMPTATAAITTKWISQLFSEAERVFDVSENASGRCKSDFERYKRHLRNQTIWAVRMSESSQWPTVGLFSGMTHHFGNYEECLKSKDLNFNGQYCTIQAVFDFAVDHPLNPKKFNFKDFPPEDESAWDAIKMYELDFHRVNRRHLSWAICVPSTCQASDIEKSLNRTLRPIFSRQNFDINIRVDPKLCIATKARPVRLFTYLYSGFILYTIFIGVPFITFYDYHRSKNKPDESERTKLMKDLFCMRSLKTALKKLTYVNEEHTYPLIHLLKLLCMIVVIIGHRFIMTSSFPQMNTESYEMYTKSKHPELVQANIVDVCFAMSGFLLFHYGYAQLNKMKFIMIFIGMLFKWIRMMPMPTVLMLTAMYLAPHVADGPLWNMMLERQAEACRSNWWQMLLGIHNVVNPDQQCLPHTWYVAADLQLTFVGLFLLWLMAKNKTLGIVIATLLLISSTIAIYFVTHVFRYDPLMLFTINNSKDVNKVINFQTLYVTPYPRLGPYLMGFLTSILSLKLRQRKLKFSNLSMTILLVTTFTIAAVSNLYGLNFYEAQRPYNAVESAIYSAFNRLLYTLPFVTLLCVYFTSGLGYLNRITTWKVFVPFGRLAYSIYLTAPSLQFYLTSSQQNYMPVMNRINICWLSGGDLVLSVVVAFVMFLFVDVPTKNILAIMGSRIMNSKALSA